MIKSGMTRRGRYALLGAAGIAFLLTMQTAGGAPAGAGRGDAAATLTLDLRLDLGAAGAALRLRL